MIRSDGRENRFLPSLSPASQSFDKVTRCADSMFFTNLDALLLGLPCCQFQLWQHRCCFGFPESAFLAIRQGRESDRRDLFAPQDLCQGHQSLKLCWHPQKHDALRGTWLALGRAGRRWGHE